MSEQKVLQLPGIKPVLSNAERERLLKAARLREKVAKSAVSERSAALLADFERQLATIYAWDKNEVWTKAMKIADEACERAEALVNEECERLGIPERYRPEIGGPHWHGRGENASQRRRAELRKVAETRIAQIEKSARTEIERISSEVQIELLAHGMSDHALALLEKMPKVDAMMPALDASEIETIATVSNHRLSYY